MSSGQTPAIAADADAGARPARHERPTRVAAVVFSYYPADPRVRRESEALVESGAEVDVVCLRGADEPASEVVRGVRVRRLPMRRKRGGKLRYLWEYAAFTLMALGWLAAAHPRRGYRVVHVHNMPDVLAFSALIPRLFGARLILDLHDPMPEVFMSKYNLAETHALARTLRFFEWLSIRFSSVVLTPNIGFRDLFIARGCPPDKIHVIMNSPQESVFGDGAAAAPAVQATPAAAPSAAEPAPDGFRIMFHGTLVERHGLGLALEALSRLRAEAPDIRFEVYGDGDYVERFLELVRERELEDIVRYHGFVSLETISSAIETIDLGLIPNLRSTFTEINFPTRIFEYLCKNKPVIAPRSKGIQDYFSEGDIFFFEMDDAESLAQAIRQAKSDAAMRQRVLDRGVEIYQRHSWRRESERLVDIVESVSGRRLQRA